MNKDEEFNPYRPEAIDETKALELTQKDQEFKDSIQGLKDNQEKLDGNYESLGNELKGKRQEDIDNDPGGFHKLKEDYDQAGIAADENRQALQQKEGEYEKFKEENGFGREVRDIDKDKGEAHKERTGRDLDQNVYGHDTGDGAPTTPVNEEVGQKAQEVAAPVKDQITAEVSERSPQHDNAVTQLEDSTPPQQAPEQTAQRNNAFTELESSAQTPEVSGQGHEQQTTPTAAAPEQSEERDNAFTQLGDTTSQDKVQAPEQDKER